MPQRAYTESVKENGKVVQSLTFQIPTRSKWKIRRLPVYLGICKLSLRTKTVKTWYMDQAERFNAFNFNKFKGWQL